MSLLLPSVTYNLRFQQSGHSRHLSVGAVSKNLKPFLESTTVVLSVTEIIKSQA